jgi:hypothetical protein
MHTQCRSIELLAQAQRLGVINPLALPKEERSMCWYRALLLALLALLSLAACGVDSPPSGAVPVAPTRIVLTEPIRSDIPTPPTHATAPAPIAAPTIAPESTISTPPPYATASPALIISPAGSGVSGVATVGSSGAAGSQVTPTALKGPVTITIQDNQQTLALTVGQIFTLDLGAVFTWDIQIGDPQIIARVADPNATDGAPQRYRALAPGQTELRATGDPRCRRAQPACMLPSIVFHLTIIVT